MRPAAFHTADLCDALPGARVLEPGFRDFGGATSFCGPIRTLALFEDNSLVRAALEQPGDGAVLVVDGGGSLRCALLGDRLGLLAVRNGWAGLLIHGCVRDTVALARLPLGIKALAACPRKSVKRGGGERDVVVRFGGVALEPGSYLYSDPDGVIVTEEPAAGP